MAWSSFRWVNDSRCCGANSGAATVAGVGAWRGLSSVLPAGAMSRAERQSRVPPREFAAGPGVRQGHGGERAHAAHQRKGAVGQQPHAQAVVDHAAHGIEPVTWMRWRRGGGGGCARWCMARLMLLLACRPTMSQSRTASKSIASSAASGQGCRQHQPNGQIGRGGWAALACRHCPCPGCKCPGRRRLPARRAAADRVFLRVDLDLAVLARKRAQVFGQKLEDGRDVGVHRTWPPHASAYSLNSPCMRSSPKSTVRVVQQAFARGVRGDATAVAVEQGGVYRGFQSDRRFAHGRCGDEFSLRRAANAASSHTATNSCSEVGQCGAQSCALSFSWRALKGLAFLFGEGFLFSTQFSPKPSPNAMTLHRCRF